jgi:hypothetical protein
MSSAGTNGTDGTDLTTTLTTQGDLVYRNASGLAKLGAGTSGQVLQTGGTGANPSWTNVSSDFVKLGETGAVSNVSSVDVNNFFTSDYKIYKIYGYGIYGISQGNAFSWRAITSGGTQTGSDYTFANAGYYRTSTTHGINNNNTWLGSDGCRLGWSGGGSGQENSWEMTVYEPESTTAYKKAHFNMAGWDGATQFINMTGAGTWRQTSAMTGINFYASGGNMYADNIIIYGVKS